MITLDQIRELSHGYIIHDQRCRNWRVNGKTKWWKRSPSRVSVPLKYGLYNYSYLNNRTQEDFHLISEENCKTV